MTVQGGGEVTLEIKYHNPLHSPTRPSLVFENFGLGRLLNSSDSPILKMGSALFRKSAVVGTLSEAVLPWYTLSKVSDDFFNSNVSTCEHFRPCCLVSSSLRCGSIFCSIALKKANAFPPAYGQAALLRESLSKADWRYFTLCVLERVADHLYPSWITA